MEENARDNARGNGSPLPDLSNREAEEAVLGAALISDEAATLVTGRLTEDVFTGDAHRTVFRSLCRLRARDQSTDMISVAEDLRRHSELAAGRTSPSRPSALQIHSLAEKVPTSAAAPYWVDILLGLARQRRMFAVAHEAERALAVRDSDPEAVWAHLLTASETIGAPEERRLMSLLEFADPDGPEVSPVWGRGQDVLWGSGEPLLLVGPPGIGKTTVAQRLMLASLGIGPPEVGGYPIRTADRPWLYIAADRPRQAARSARRMLDAAGAWGDDRLQTHFRMWRGPLGWDITREPERLATWARQLGVGTVVVDSLKDVASELAKPEQGQAIHLALQYVVDEGIDVMVLHHQRKSTPDNRTPRALDDVYGSAWITAGAGSVVLLWGKPGDPVVELHHLKQPVEDVGPMTLHLDHTAGVVSRIDRHDPVSILREQKAGLATRQVAEILFDTPDPDRNQIEKARRRLESAEGRGQVTHQEIVRPRGGKPDHLWFAVAHQTELL